MVPILDYRSLRDFKEHPTQKPLRLLRYLVENYTKHGDFILDPFAGTATTIVACQHAGLDSLGIEKNTEYATFGQERLATPASRETQATLDTTAPINEPQNANKPVDQPARHVASDRMAQKRKK
jgi:DNA modification methylase